MTVRAGALVAAGLIVVVVAFQETRWSIDLADRERRLTETQKRLESERNEITLAQGRLATQAAEWHERTKNALLALDGVANHQGTALERVKAIRDQLRQWKSELEAPSWPR